MTRRAVLGTTGAAQLARTGAGKVLEDWENTGKNDLYKQRDGIGNTSGGKKEKKNDQVPFRGNCKAGVRQNAQVSIQRNRIAVVGFGSTGTPEVKRTRGKAETKRRGRVFPAGKVDGRGSDGRGERKAGVGRHQ